LVDDVAYADAAVDVKVGGSVVVVVTTSSEEVERFRGGGGTLGAG
jgi:hypothetical protein